MLEYYDFALELALKTWARGEEAERIERLVRELAALPPERGCRDATELTEKVRARPELANVEVGRFVSQRQHYDYSDVRIPNSGE